MKLRAVSLRDGHSALRESIEGALMIGIDLRCSESSALRSSRPSAPLLMLFALDGARDVAHEPGDDR